MDSYLADLFQFGPPLLKGAWVTIQLTVISLAISLVVGLFTGLARISTQPLLRIPAAFYVNLIRGTPLLVQLMYVYFVFPEIGINLTPVQAAIVGLSLNEGAYLAEVFRAGIQSIGKGQFEAAYAVGMTYGQAMRRIILPQAVRNVLPPIGNSAIILLKNSSLAAIITVTELMHTGDMLATSTFKNIRIFSMVAVLYWLLHYPLARLTEWLERRGSLDPAKRRQQVVREVAGAQRL